MIPESGSADILISPSSVPGNVTNSGVIKAVSAYLSSANGNVYALAGNNGGLIEATGTRTINGQVWLTAPNGMVSVNSTLSAPKEAVIDGKNTTVGSNASISVSGAGDVKIGLSPLNSESLNTTILSGPARHFPPEKTV
jgi:hypothetical protein